jgi:hypothetical protein
MEAHPEPLEVYVGAVEPNLGVLEAHPGALEAHPEAMEAHAGPVDTHPGAHVKFLFEDIRTKQHEITQFFECKANKIAQNCNKFRKIKTASV